MGIHGHRFLERMSSFYHARILCSLSLQRAVESHRIEDLNSNYGVLVKVARLACEEYIYSKEGKKLNLVGLIHYMKDTKKN